MKLFFRRMTPFLIIIIAMVLAVALYMTKKTPDKKEDEVTLPTVNVLPVKQQTLALTLPSYGTVQPKYKTQLVSEVNGRILSISPAFFSGAMIKKGTVLAKIEPFDYEAELSQAQSNLAQAQASLEEEIALGKVAKIEFSDFNSGLPPELGLRVPQLKHEQANVKYAKAVLASAQRNLERTVIRAPFDGIVKSRDVDLGQYVTVSTVLGELYDTSIAEIRLPLADADLAYLTSAMHPDTPVTITNSFAGNKLSWQGQIVRNEGIVDANNRMVYLVAEVLDPYQLNQPDKIEAPLKFGSFVNAEIKGKTIVGLVKLPRHLVRNNHVTLITADNRVEMRPVNIVHSDLNYVYVKDSLKTNELVSQTNLSHLLPGELVKVINKPETEPAKPIESIEK